MHNNIPEPTYKTPKALNLDYRYYTKKRGAQERAFDLWLYNAKFKHEI